MSGLSDEIRAKSNENARKAKQLSPSIQYAICQVLPNIVNGAFWGFTNMNNVKKHMEEIKSDPKITARKLGNACLIEVDPTYLLEAVRVIDASAITQKDLQVMKESMADACISFQKFLITKGKAGFGGTIGIYCVNNVKAISYKGVNYPAFRISMGEALKQLSKYGYKIQVKGSFVDARTAIGAGQALWDTAQLSPTNTGVFINIKSTYTPEQMKKLEAEFKQTYGIK